MILFLSRENQKPDVYNHRDQFLTDPIRRKASRDAVTLTGLATGIKRDRYFYSLPAFKPFSMIKY